MSKAFTEAEYDLIKDDVSRGRSLFNIATNRLNVDGQNQSQCRNFYARFSKEQESEIIELKALVMPKEDRQFLELLEDYECEEYTTHCIPQYVHEYETEEYLGFWSLFGVSNGELVGIEITRLLSNKEEEYVRNELAEEKLVQRNINISEKQKKAIIRVEARKNRRHAPRKKAVYKPPPLPNIHFLQAFFRCGNCKVIQAVSKEAVNELNSPNEKWFVATPCCSCDMLLKVGRDNIKSSLKKQNT